MPAASLLFFHLPQKIVLITDDLFSVHGGTSLMTLCFGGDMQA